MPSARAASLHLLVHDLVESGPVPTCLDPEGCYPYPSFCETARRPRRREVRCVVLENEHLRAVVCPELGGRLMSLVDLASGRESLFSDPVVRPVRILPRQAFISGGIEVSFPIAHTPTQIETVSHAVTEAGGRVYVTCGERELRFGMQWSLEFSLGGDDRFLTQRMRVRNPGTRSHPWTSWSNAAVPAHPGTEFHFPGGPVLEHSDAIREIAAWENAGPRRQSDVGRMTGWFWKAPDVNAFGVFTPARGCGLYHIADRDEVRGIKLWSYGCGPDEVWARDSGISGVPYLEIQAGPVPDQSIKHELAPDAQRCWTEYWIPSPVPLDIRSLALPRPALRPPDAMETFGWTPGPATAYWLALEAAAAARRPALLPGLPPAGGSRWAPSGMEGLGAALAWAFEATGNPHYRFQQAAWLAGSGRPGEAVALLHGSADDEGRMLCGVLMRRLGDSPAAAECLRGLSDPSFVLHPQIVVERDLALAALGDGTLAERAAWLDRVAGLDDEGLVERRAALAHDQGRDEEALALFSATSFQRVHQRYVRSELWKSIQRRLGADAPPPASLGEDVLARWGAYREFDG